MDPLTCPPTQEHSPQPQGSAPRPRNVAPSLSICSGSGKACGMPQHSLNKALLQKKKKINIGRTEVEKGKFVEA